jgi:hypothetical protein
VPADSRPGSAASKLSRASLAAVPQLKLQGSDELLQGVERAGARVPPELLSGLLRAGAAKVDMSWAKNDDWSEAGVEAWLAGFADQHPELLEIKTPPLRQEQRDRVVAACERRGLLTALQGFGKLRAVLVSRHGAEE